MDHLATGLGVSRIEIAATPMPLVAYRNKKDGAGQLHVYLDGDGTPWLTRRQISPDPTPRNPVALRLMALDPGPSLYLARPCYNGAATSSGCGPWYWTSGRYSATVVEQMASALRRLAEEERIEEITLIGYSGGGVLAWHLARELPQVRRLITIAANLDLDAWTALHGFSPLAGSLDPAQGPPLREEVRQWHLAGRRDDNVPFSVIVSTMRRLAPEARVLVVDADHHCCWEAIWPSVLEALRDNSTPAD